MKWLIQKFDNDNHQRLIDSLKRVGVEYQEAKYSGFNSHLNTSPKLPEIQPPNWAPEFFAYGSLAFIQFLQRKTRFSVTTYCNLKDFSCSYYYNFLNPIFQSSYQFIPYGLLKRNKQRLLDQLGVDGQVFIRPNSGDKKFTGKLINASDWDLDIDNLSYHPLSLATWCVVARPQKIAAEYRFFVGSNYEDSPTKYRIISGSKYKENGRLLDHFTDDIPTPIYWFADSVLKATNFRTDPFWVLDIAEQEGRLSVLEINSMSCSGFYGCDIDSIVLELNGYLTKEWSDLDNIYG